ncbi:helix-turn-helix transcriptional regulator [Streptomyces coelicoflavus]|uniref:helix-turn-helix transcriptional regulator n=1 Tax=Streptomyces coelicoflavus TaxID=285562 RepID=UPI0036C76DC9
MADGKIEDALRRLGLGEPAIRVYAALLANAPTTLEELATACRLGSEPTCAAYTELVDVGLARAVGREGDVVAPVPPAVGLQILGRSRTAEIDASCVTVSGAFDTFRRSRLAGTQDEFLEVVTGDDIGPRVRRAWASASERIRQLDSPPYFPFTGGVDDALETLARGVEQRVVYSRASLEHPGNLVRNIEPTIAAGDEARVLPSVPVKLIIIDDAFAMVSLAIEEADAHNTMLVVKPCGLFSALVALFEQCWQSGLPFHGGAAPPPQRLLPAERRLLALLAGGVSDDDIAREFGISRRTLFRRVEVLMARLGARTRFQMALQAQRRGWL